MDPECMYEIECSECHVFLGWLLGTALCELKDLQFLCAICANQPWPLSPVESKTSHMKVYGLVEGQMKPNWDEPCHKHSTNRSICGCLPDTR